MNDLLAPELAEDLAVTYDKKAFPKLFNEAARCAHWLHNYGRKFDLGQPGTVEARSWRQGKMGQPAELPGERLWWDPEVYLSALDSAAAHPGQPRHLRLRGALEKFFEREQHFCNRTERPELLAIAAATRRLFAAQTSSFVQALDWSEELCQPYLRWAKELITPEDHVVTFNYDLVPDKLAIETSTLQTVLPDGSVPKTCAPVLKLHGSVDWVKAKNGQVSKAVRDDMALVCDDDALAVATPGPGKLDVSNRLEPLWSMAQNALRNATSIVVLGFRFPPADSHARERLLSAVSENEDSQLRVQIILGPETQKADVLRTKRLFEFALACRKAAPPATATADPLLVEDFLSIAVRSELVAFR